MGRMSLVFLLFFVSASVYAKVYKCKQDDGAFLFSDKACAENDQAKRNQTLEYNGSTIYLSTREEAIPLPSLLVTDFLDRINQACLDKSGSMLLNQFSSRMRNKITEQVASDDAIFTNLSYMCDEIKNIDQEITNAKGQMLFATKMSYRSTVLCLYQADRGLDNCIGNTKIIAEDNQIKLNGY